MSGLLGALVDDAGLFPPTSLDMRSAVRRHRGDLAGGEPMLAHRFLCPAARIGEFIAELSPEDRFRVILIGGADPAATREAIRLVIDTPALTLVAVEWAPMAITPPPSDVAPEATQPAAASEATQSAAAPEATQAGAALDTALRTLADAGAGPDVPLFAEPSDITGAAAMTAAIVAARASAGRPLGLKLRCGGVRPDLFPSATDLATALVTAAEAGVPVKATAGLHHAVRHVDPATGFTHFGYLNVLLASAQAQRGRSVADVASVLLDEDADRLRALAESLGPEEARRVRTGFASYGSCSTSTPVREAAELGLSARVTT
ncbi:hypothetical protein [Microtetraspora sp. NBRC 16547]|uniref:hypothetical protein n=1 Tax=Microtetraspora sp. NBRC 16547 TaxID=3030993 RepID=UPI0024A492C1|nr:hypothetical protein [Microtetraspora sp. NBRC 16547]GLX00500.1 hypothetical protein Misp02_45860 [Microtetraspora sp. NBRC 16547]